MKATHAQRSMLYDVPLLTNSYSNMISFIQYSFPFSQTLPCKSLPLLNFTVLLFFFFLNDPAPPKFSPLPHPAPFPIFPPPPLAKDLPPPAGPGPGAAGAEPATLPPHHVAGYPAGPSTRGTRPPAGRRVNGTGRQSGR